MQIQAGEETAKDLGQRHGKENVAYRRIDVSSANSVQEVFDFCVETLGRVDVVVNNAGVNGESNWESMLDINLKVIEIQSLMMFVISCQTCGPKLTTRGEIL